MVIVDCDCIIQFLRGNRRAVAYLASIIKGISKPKTTAFTVNVDPYIASIVIQNDEELVTRNIDHFKEIPRIKLVNWEKVAFQPNSPEP